MNEILRMLAQLIERIRALELQSPQKALVIFGALLIFGALNCFLGYRLMRFWMMLVGFAMGGLATILVMKYLLQIPTSPRSRYIYAALIIGVVVAAVSFLFYRAGLFILAASMAAILAVYFIRPNSSETFFLCLLAGIVTGLISLRFDREIIVLITSVFGGILAGYALSRILSVPEIGYELLLCAGLSAAGLVIQFATNKRTTNASPSLEADSHPESEPDSSGEDPAVVQARQSAERQAREDFYEEYFHGGDVFDRTTKEIRDLTGEGTYREDIHYLAWKQKKEKNRLSSAKDL